MQLTRRLPARRRLLAGVLILLGLAGVAAGVSAALSRSHPTSATARRDQPGPVLLVPGYGGSTGSLHALAARIRAAGRPAIVVRLPGNGTGSLVTDAAALSNVAHRALRGGAGSVDVVGYSAGGVVALIWARTDGGAGEARRIVTLGSPFHGTLLAGAAENLVPGACPPACQQLAPGSPLLKSLAVGAPRGPRWLSLWTRYDDVVIPADSARLQGAVNLAIQSVCPADQVTHTDLPADPVVAALVLQAIGTGPIRPGDFACRP